MANMKSLADQLRAELTKPGPKTKSTGGDKTTPGKGTNTIKPVKNESGILAAIRAFDNSQNKNMVHVRFDAVTVRLMNQFKMATDVDVTKLVAYAVKTLFENHPELKNHIKQFIQNTDL